MLSNELSSFHFFQVNYLVLFLACKTSCCSWLYIFEALYPQTLIQASQNVFFMLQTLGVKPLLANKQQHPLGACSSHERLIKLVKQSYQTLCDP